MASALFLLGRELQPSSCEFAIGDICFVQCRTASMRITLRITAALLTRAQPRFHNNTTIRVPQFPQFALMTAATTVSTTMVSNNRQQFLASVLTRLTPTWMPTRRLPHPQRLSYLIAHLRLPRRSVSHSLNTHLPRTILSVDRASGPLLLGRSMVLRKMAPPT